MNETIDNRAVNTVRTLAIDAIEKSKSGHPGMPKGMAPAGRREISTFWKK